jgi:hypothetical protein
MQTAGKSTNFVFTRSSSRYCRSSVILNVTQDAQRLKVIEVTSDEAGASIAERYYSFRGPVPPGRDQGTIKTAGRRTVLRSAGQLERWSISEDGSELIVNRWIDIQAKGPQRVLVFRRSDRVVE